MFEHITNRLRRWHRRNVTRRHLSWLDDRLLADIGTERGSIGDFIVARDREGEC